MRTVTRWGLVLGLAIVGLASGQESLDEIVAAQGLYRGTSQVKGDATQSLTGKMMVGYQGWFRAAGDGSKAPWFHYGRSGKFEPGVSSVEMWPDMSEAGPEEKYPTGYKMKDGSVASVFSSLNRATVVRHFQWMKEYGIDGAFVQRFTVSTKSPNDVRDGVQVLANCREGANQFGRSYAVMYDTDFDRATLDQVKADWKRLVDGMQITSDPAYLRHKGKPVISLWGCGFNHRKWDTEATRELMDFLQNDPNYGKLTIMLGVPTHWFKLEGDSLKDPAVREIIERADIVSPWMVGRSSDAAGVERAAAKHWKPEIAWAKERKRDYLPVVFPGFSWSNLKPGAEMNQVPRDGGKFLWKQMFEAKQAGAEMIYVAMFDEIDEATAIFKVANEVPVGETQFLTYEGLPDDHYLWLTGEGGRMLRGEIPATAEIPKR